MMAQLDEDGSGTIDCNELLELIDGVLAESYTGTLTIHSQYTHSTLTALKVLFIYSKFAKLENITTSDTTAVCETFD